MLPDDIDPVAAGLNHFTWVLGLRRKSTGEDLYPAFRTAIEARDIVEVGTPSYCWEVRLSRYLMQSFGLWPWEFCGLDGYDFDAADARAMEQEDLLRRLATGEEPVDGLLARPSGERAVPIILGVIGNTHQYELAVNVPNNGIVPNLPSWAIVEVPAVIDATGVHGLPVGPLPEPIAAMCRTQISVMDRVVEAGAHGDRRAALQALLLDPVVESPAQAEGILDELLQVHGDLLPQFQVR